MTNEEKAKVILEHLEQYINVDHAFEKFYIRGIVNGLKQIDTCEFGNTE